jgi:protease PrsW
MIDAQSALLIGAVAFVPPIVFMGYIRSQEKTGREPWGALATTFVFGAVVSVIFALILQQIFHVPGREYDFLEGQLRVPSIVFLVVVIAPLTEEFAKGLGVRSAKRWIREEEDGIVYGAAAGFGFSATENLLYELSALNENGQTAYLMTAIVRTFTGCFLHATAAGLVGYGLSRRYIYRRGLLSVLPFYIAAVLLHAAFNLIAVLNLAFAVGLIIVLSFLGIRYTVRRIRTLDTIPTFTSSGGPP